MVCHALSASPTRGIPASASPLPPSRLSGAPRGHAAAPLAHRRRQGCRLRARGRGRVGADGEPGVAGGRIIFVSHVFVPALPFGHGFWIFYIIAIEVVKILDDPR